MRRSDRLFELIQILRRAPAPMAAHAIGELLEVGKRTVYRDIATLQSMRVPIEGEAGIGYVMRQGFDLPPLMFTAEELESIVVGLRLIDRVRDEDLRQAAARVRRKLADVIPQRLGAIDDVPLRTSSWSDIPPSDADCGMMRRAIREERKMSFEYRNSTEAGPTVRTVLPLTLTYWIDGIVLGAWCELRCDYRHFRLDRMTGCSLSDEHFVGQGGKLRRSLETPRR